jgi:acyl-CoA reductase-like NAD-dependent aldehyde dehydrogenase
LADAPETAVESVNLAHHINGRWEQGDGPSFTVVNPSSGHELGNAPIASPNTVSRAVESAKSALKSWRHTTPKERGEYLYTLAELMQASRHKLATLESLNVGRPLAETVEEIPPLVDLLRFYAGAFRANTAPASGQYERDSTSLLLREPIGVLGLITPWNYPLTEAVWKIAPALAAGNTVVLKPSEYTPYTTVALVQLIESVFPPGVVNLVLGDGTTGAAIVDHPGIGMVSLTGDSSTGKKIAAAASKTLKRVQLELGGKAPVLVFGDADIDRAAVYLAQAAFGNAGQVCTAPCRLIVHAAVYDNFLSRYLEAVQQLRVGDPFDPASQVGPLISERQMDRVLGFLQAAESSSASVLTGGARMPRPGFFIEPTVLADLSQDNELVQKEIFGPVVTIQRAVSDEQMLEWANDVNYSLSASLWTSDLDRSLKLMSALNFGTIWVNGHHTTVPEMPFGGFGRSGYGKVLSAQSIDEYSQLKHVMIHPSR